VDSKRRIIVGLNDFIESDDVPIEILRIGEEAAAKQDWNGCGRRRATTRT
jgi:methylmalonyl-CoA mutase N-terminal domain/subunit